MELPFLNFKFEFGARNLLNFGSFYVIGAILNNRQSQTHTLSLIWETERATSKPLMKAIAENNHSIVLVPAFFVSLSG
jgi:hypothetical protein